VERLENPRNDAVTGVGRSIIDAPSLIAVPVCSAPMTRVRLVFGLLAVVLGGAAACGGSSTPANNQTTVTLQSPDASAPAPAPGK